MCVVFCSSPNKTRLVKKHNKKIIKNFFDRSISYVKPQFRKVYDEMHHVKRYKKKLNIEYYFYGDIEDNEKETLEKLIKANQENLDSNVLINIIDIGEYCYE